MEGRDLVRGGCPCSPGRRSGEELAAALPEGSWGTIGPVQGATGASIISDQYVGWAVSAHSEEPEIAAHFLLYLSSADNNTHFAKETGALPIHVSALEMEPSLLEGDRGGEMYMMEKNDWYQYADPPVMYQAYETWPAQRDQLARELLAGSLTGEELLAEMDAIGPRPSRPRVTCWASTRKRTSNNKKGTGAFWLLCLLYVLRF